MNPNVKVIWLEALRSGLYQQGRSLLKYQDVSSEQMYYCCLGVLCDLAEKQGIVRSERDVVRNRRDDRTEVTYCFGEHGRASLPEEVMNWAGIDSPFGQLQRWVNGIYSELAALNDGGGYNFLQIADVIEEQF